MAHARISSEGQPDPQACLDKRLASAVWRVMAPFDEALGGKAAAPGITAEENPKICFASCRANINIAGFKRDGPAKTS